MKVKLFSIKNLKNEQTLEQNINTWLAANTQINVVHIKQSCCGGSMNPSLWMVSVWYEEGKS